MKLAILSVSLPESMALAVTGTLLKGHHEALLMLLAVCSVALLLSIVLMFLLHQLQLAQERFVLDAQAYCEKNLIRHLQSG